MKKVFLLCCMAVVALSFGSCCNDGPDSLSAGTVEDLVQDMIEESGQEQSYATLKTGYYESFSFAEREKLFKLQQAGLIDFKAEIFDWYTKVIGFTTGYDDYGYVTKIPYTNYYEDKHIFVKVELTEEGKKLLVDSIPQPEPQVDEDMKAPDINPEDYPENKVKYTENWPKLPNPEDAKKDQVKADEEELVEQDIVQPVNNLIDDVDEAVQVISKNQKAISEAMKSGQAVMPLDLQTKNAYDAAKKKEKAENVILLSSKFKVKKARFIQIYENEEHVKCARAEIIVEYTDATVAGRVLQNKFDGTRFCAPVELTYFYDKGWVLQTKSLHFSDKSSMGNYMASKAELSGGEVGHTGNNEGSDEGPAAEAPVENDYSTPGYGDDEYSEYPEYDGDIEGDI